MITKIWRVGDATSRMTQDAVEWNEKKFDDWDNRYCIDIPTIDHEIHQVLYYVQLAR